MACKLCEKSKKDIDTKTAIKRYGKEGSKKEEAFDKKQVSKKLPKRK